MLKKFLFTLTIFSACSYSSSNLLAAQTGNFHEIKELTTLGIQPNALKAFLQKEAPDLVQFIAKNPTIYDVALYGTIAKSKKPVVVKFYLKGCGPCKRMGPIVEKAAKEFSESITVINIELTDKTRYLMQVFNARGVPTLVFFKDGKKAEQFTGMLSQAELTYKINKLVN